MIAELTYVKAHLRIDGSAENDLITSYSQAAQEVVEKYINRTEVELYEEYGHVPSAIKNAVCMIAGSLYRDREATNTNGVGVNPVVAAMLKPFKKIVR